MAGIQIVGNANSSTAQEVEVNTRAARVVIRPDDWGSLGIYKIGANNGTTGMAAGISAASPIFAFRNSTTNIYCVKKVLFSFGSAGTGFAAGSAQFNMFVCRSFSANDTGGTSVVPTSNSNKLRATMATTGVADIRISSTAALGTGTRTPDGQPVASITVPVPVTTSFQMIGPQASMFEQRIGEHPLALAQNEGFEIQATVPATGLWFFGVSVDWEELAAY